MQGIQGYQTATTGTGVSKCMQPFDLHEDNCQPRITSGLGVLVCYEATSITMEPYLGFSL